MTTAILVAALVAPASAADGVIVTGNLNGPQGILVRIYPKTPGPSYGHVKESVNQSIARSTLA
jgi:hypothetical protein